MSTTYKDLQAKIEALQKEAEQLRQNERAAAIADIKNKMEAYGITITDLGFRSAAAPRTSKKTTSVAPKFRDPASGEAWSGRGRTPKWLQHAIDEGKSKEDFLLP